MQRRQNSKRTVSSQTIAASTLKVRSLPHAAPAPDQVDAKRAVLATDQGPSRSMSDRPKLKKNCVDCDRCRDPAHATEMALDPSRFGCPLVTMISRAPLMLGTK